MAGVRGKSGRHESDIKREGYFFRLRPEVIARVERCTLLLELQEGARMSKAEAFEHLLTMACEALERTREGREAPLPMSISGISEISSRQILEISSILCEDISVPGYGFPEDPEDADEIPAPVGHTNGTATPVPETPAQLVPEKAHGDNTVLQDDAEQTDIPAYDATKYVLGKLCPQRHEWGTTGQSRLTIRDRVCPECRNALKRRKRAEKHQVQPA